MLIPLGILDFPVAGGTYDLLETEILTADASSVTFSSLSSYASDYQHLQIRIAARCSRTGGGSGGLGMRLNTDTGSNYSNHELYGTGTSVFSGAGTSTTNMFLGLIASATYTADSFSGLVIDILDPFETTKYPTVRSLAGVSSSTSRISLQSGSWRNTASLTDITFIERLGSSDYVIGSRFSLYGFKGA